MLEPLHKVDHLQLNLELKKQVKSWQRSMGGQLIQFIFQKLCMIFEIKQKGVNHKINEIYTFENILASMKNGKTHDLIALNTTLSESLRTLISINS